MNKIISRRLKTTTALTSILMASIVVDNSLANPEGGKVVAGDVTITEPNPTTVQVDQFSQKAIVDWRSFNIAPNETTRFVQPNSQAWILNRINGSHNPTTIQGTLEANGNVAIVNPDGIVFSQGARIDVNSLIATTHNISNDDFMAGQMNFNIPGNPAASVINEGSISIGDHGLGAFVAPGVRNSGVITARLGYVSLAAGNKFTLDLYGDGLVNLAIDDQITHEVIDLKTGKLMSDLVKNSGTIKADGGTVALKAATARRAVNAVINNTGVIEANTIGMKNGKIILGAQTAATKPQNAPQQKVKVSGRLQTTALPTRVPIPKPSPRTGGDIEITGEAIELANATIDASGVNGGGAILIGGDYLGGNGDAAIIDQYNIPLAKHKVPTAKFLTANAGSLIKADALENGNGGKIILWSDDTTSTAADITAKGGNLGGDGGFIETSGKQLLDIKKAADASAVDGAAGTWLLDPDNLTVTDDVSGSSDVTFGERANPSSPHYMTANGTNSLIESSVIEAGLNNGTDVFLAADGHIGIEADIEKSSGDNSTLTINAGDGLYIYGTDIVSTSNQLNVKLIANNLGIFDYTNSDDLTTPIFQTNGGHFDIEAKGPDSGIEIRSAKINTKGGMVSLELQSGNRATGNGNGTYLTDTILETHGGDIRIFAIDGRISSPKGNLFDTGGGDLLMVTEAERYPNNMSLNTGAFVRTTGGDAQYFAGGQLRFDHADIQTEGGNFEAANSMLSFSFSGSHVETSGGDVELASADDIVFGATGIGNNYEPSKIDSGSGDITLRTDDDINLVYGTLLQANQINASAEQISYQSTPYEGLPEIPSADYPFVSKSGITLTGSEFDIPLYGDDTAKLELNYEGDDSGNERYSLTPIKGFSTIGLNRGDIDSGSYWFWIYGSGGDNIRGTFEPDGAHFTQGLSIKTSRSVQIDVGDQADTQSGLYFPSSENSEIFTTLDSTDGKIEFFGVNNINGETPAASSLSVGGTKNVWLNSVKYSAPIVPDPTPITYTPKPVSGASLPTGNYAIGERIDIPLPTLFSVDGGSIVSQTVSRPTDGDFQIITVNGQKHLVGTYNGNPGTINLTFEAISDTQKSAQLSLPITFTSANVVTPTVTPEPTPTPTVITSQKEEVQEEVTLVENPENRVKIPVRPIRKNALNLDIDDIVGFLPISENSGEDQKVQISTPLSLMTDQPKITELSSLAVVNNILLQGNEYPINVEKWDNLQKYVNYNAEIGKAFPIKDGSDFSIAGNLTLGELVDSRLRAEEYNERYEQAYEAWEQLAISIERHPELVNDPEIEILRKEFSEWRGKYLIQDGANATIGTRALLAIGETGKFSLDLGKFGKSFGSAYLKDKIKQLELGASEIGQQITQEDFNFHKYMKEENLPPEKIKSVLSITKSIDKFSELHASLEEGTSSIKSLFIEGRHDEAYSEAFSLLNKVSNTFDNIDQSMGTERSNYAKIMNLTSKSNEVRVLMKNIKYLRKAQNTKAMSKGEIAFLYMEQILKMSDLITSWGAEFTGISGELLQNVSPQLATKSKSLSSKLSIAKTVTSSLARRAGHERKGLFSVLENRVRAQQSVYNEHADLIARTIKVIEKHQSNL